MLAPRAADQGLTLSHGVDAALPDRIEGDEARLKQILFNLAGNAVKFTETGGVLISVTTQASQFRLSVRDSGPGISPQDQKRLFQHFERGAAERKSAPGAGLGLVMVKRLAEAMGGSVGIQSEPGCGSQFWVDIPIKALKPAPSTRPLSGRTLLIATPDPLQREGIRVQAEALGATTLEAISPDDAEDQLRSTTAEVTVVLDEDWADHAPKLKACRAGARLLALAEPRTKDLFSGSNRPASVDGWLVAPVRSSSLAAWAIGEGTAEDDVGGPANESIQPLDGVQLILAEDDPVNAMIAKTVLKKLGAAVEHVESGRAAVELAATGRFDAALLDLRMPEMGGLEAASAIRTLPSAAALPLIALTANATEADRNACLAAGMDAFMTKPLDPALLADRLTALCAPQNRANVGKAS